MQHKRGAKSEKVAISLPHAVFKEVETERRSTGESRSAFFRRAAETLLRRKREQEAVKQYLKGYLRMPESAEEMTEVEAVALETLSAEPWDEKG